MVARVSVRVDRAELAMKELGACVSSELALVARLVLADGVVGDELLRPVAQALVKVGENDGNCAAWAFSGNLDKPVPSASAASAPCLDFVGRSRSWCTVSGYVAHT